MISSKSKVCYYTILYFIKTLNIQREIIKTSKNQIDVKNKVRGLNSVPGAYCYLDDLRMKVYLVEIEESSKYSDRGYGEIVEVTNDSIVVRCSDGLIYIKDIAIEGKKRCLVKDYFNGIKKESLIGKVLK